MTQLTWDDKPIAKLYSLSERILSGWKHDNPFPLPSAPENHVHPKYVISKFELEELISEIFKADKLAADRDALLVALRMIAGLGKESLTVDRDSVFGHQKIARAAIAAAENKPNESG